VGAGATAPRVRLIHFNGPEGRERQLRLAALGFAAQFEDLEGTSHSRFMRDVRENPPDAIVIDLSRLPSHGREIAVALRRSKDTRHVPLVFVDGEPEKVARIKGLLPDATYTTWGRLKTALPRALAQPVSSPAVPSSELFYAGRPVVAKLGVKSGMRVCLLGAPKGFADTLQPMPARVTLTARPQPASDIYLAFVRSRHDLVTQLGALAPEVQRATVWAVWPKTASKIKTDLNGNVVREIGLAGGWVDFKICSIDDTWSALAFKRRDRR
jgi:hypothetical protein